MLLDIASLQVEPAIPYVSCHAHCNSHANFGDFSVRQFPK